MLTFGHPMVLESSKSDKQKTPYNEELESLSIWEKTIPHLLISQALSILSTNILTLSTSPSLLMVRLLISLKPSGLEKRKKSLKKNIKSFMNSCSLVTATSTECTSSLMYHWQSRLWSMSPKLMMTSSVCNNKKVVSVCILKRFLLKKIVNKSYFLTSWDSFEVSLIVKTFHSTFPDKIIKTQH